MIWCMIPEIPGTTDRIFCYFKPFFALLPPNNPKSQNFGKIKKSSGDIITLHMCTINDNHMMYGSWDMECDGRNFLSFWTVFAILLPWQPKKSKFWQTERNAWGYHNFTQVYQKSWSYCYLDMMCNECNCYFLFWAIFCPFTSLATQKVKI